MRSVPTIGVNDIVSLAMSRYRRAKIEGGVYFFTVVHFNPVKHGHVTRVIDWPHSSFHRYVARGVLPADWGGDVGEMIGPFGE